MLKKTILTVSFIAILTCFFGFERTLHDNSMADVKADTGRIMTPLLPSDDGVDPLEYYVSGVEFDKFHVISVYDGIMRRAAAEAGQDWRLLSAIAYHESRFDPNAVSKAGAMGLMQIMPRVAREYNVSQEEAFQPEVNVRLATEVLDRLSRSLKFGASASEEDRLSILLACYVGGIGHVSDARRLAAKSGENPDSWEVVSRYLSLKSQPEFYEDPVVKCGKFTGVKQTMAYVRNVTSHYRHYCDIVER